MALSLDDIRHLARLARLGLDDAELERLGADLNEIVGYVEQLSKVDVEGVEPLFSPVPAGLRRRADEVAEGIGRRGLEGSQGYEEGLVRVPKIVE